MTNTATDTKDKLITHTMHLFAREGYEGVSLRKLANEVPISPSVVYHYFSDKDALLFDMYLASNKKLGELRNKLPEQQTAIDMLRQRIEFQFDNAELIIAVLKYYLHFRDSFLGKEQGTLPEKAILHIIEVLEFGNQTGEFKITDIPGEAKVIAHSINGYILEYYPKPLKGSERKEVVDSITQFCARSLVQTRSSTR